MAHLIRSNGDVSTVTPKNGKYFTLAELTEFVDGYVEVAHTRDGKIMVVNEDGSPMGLPYNAKATALYEYGEHHNIVGDVIVGSEDEIRLDY